MNMQTALYDNIGEGYNATRQADPQITQLLFELLQPKNDGTYIDIGCGTGNYTIALADMGLRFYGIEPSEKMLRIAQSKNSKIHWLISRAEQIPIKDGVIDGAIATLTIHHWTDLEKAFEEIYRVMKPGARLVIFTADPEQMKCYWLNHYFPKMMAAAITQMPGFEIVKGALTAAGFKIVGTKKYFIADSLKDMFLYSGKNRPELYFDEQVRSGISSFMALAHKDEVPHGLSELEDDISTGRFRLVKNNFDDTKGDYLFITAEKHSENE